jgi:hypothetical protein
MSAILLPGGRASPGQSRRTLVTALPALRIRSTAVLIGSIATAM